MRPLLPTDREGKLVQHDKLSERVPIPTELTNVNLHPLPIFFINFVIDIVPTTVNIDVL